MPRRDLLLTMILAHATFPALAGCGELATRLGGGPSYVVLDDAQGIAVGDPVRIHGVSVGRVSEVGLVPEGARVAFELTDPESLRADACGTVRRDGLVGEPYLHLEPGRAEAPFEGNLATCASSSMDATVAETVALLSDLRGYVAALERGERALCTVTAVAPTSPTAPAGAPVAPAAPPERMPEAASPEEAPSPPATTAEPSPAP